MTSETPGLATSGVEVSNITANGVWVLADGRELFMSYQDFPWFKDASVAEILNVEQPMPGHLYWPDLDVDLGLDTIEHPERFPLKSQ